MAMPAWRVKGFSYIEMMVTLLILSVLATIAIPSVENMVQRRKEAELREALREIRTAIDAYKAAADSGKVAKAEGESGYPRKLEDLVAGVEDAKDTKRPKIYFMRRLPRDPFAVNPDIAAVQTWGRRSYASPPNAPAAGDDVFDVYSLSNAIGLNGIPHREW
jgi:general secretion pathway protein G